VNTADGVHNGHDDNISYCCTQRQRRRRCVFVLHNSRTSSLRTTYFSANCTFQRHEYYEDTHVAKTTRKRRKCAWWARGSKWTTTVRSFVRAYRLTDENWRSLYTVGLLLYAGGRDGRLERSNSEIDPYRPYCVCVCVCVCIY